MKKTWTFELVADRATTSEEERSFCRYHGLSTGEIGYSSGGGYPTRFGCELDAETLEDAVNEATRRIRKAIPGVELTLDPDYESSDCKA